MNEDEAPATAADIRAMAEQAEAEAAEAEALAAAARARARAIQLRQEAELAEAAEMIEPQTDEPAEGEAEGSAAADKPAWYRRWRRPRVSTVAAIVAVIVICASLAASGYMVWEHRNASQQRQRVAEFAAAARQGAVTLTSLDFNHAKQDVQRVIDNSTGAFKDDFQKTADDFTKVVEESQVVERGTVAATAVDLGSITNDSAVVLVASTAEVTNAAGAKQDPRNFRLIVTLTRDGDQLKMSKVQFVP